MVYSTGRRNNPRKCVKLFILVLHWWVGLQVEQLGDVDELKPNSSKDTKKERTPHSEKPISSKCINKIQDKLYEN